MKFSPSKVIILFFIVIIFLGTILLMLPFSTTEPTKFLDKLFTATSATCVTGLTVFDIGTKFTIFGQMVILLCIQIGGLGYMVLGTLLMIFFGRVSLGQKNVVSESLNLNNLTHSKQLNKVLLQVLIFTFVIEIIGAVLFFIRFYSETSSISKSIYYGIFHSISAFCNAGFTLFSTNFERYSSDIMINFIIPILTITGGLGFVVVLDLVNKLRTGQKMLFHSRIVFLITGSLIFIGMIFILLLDNSTSFLSLSVKERVLISWFQSVTSRTSGFNTFSINNFSGLSVLVITFLMFIGASPGGTGGGIKTTTFFVVSYFIYTFSHGEKDLSIFKRRISIDIVIKSFVIFVSSLFFVLIMSMILFYVSNFSFMECFFETVSAFGTVGLSLGITPNLDNLSKILLIITMFLGRVGSLTLLTALLLGEPKDVKYLQEDIAIG